MTEPLTLRNERRIAFRVRLGRFSFTADTAGSGVIRRWVLKTPWGSLRLHHLLRSDDRHYHDHTFDFTSRVLRGEYTEHRPNLPPVVHRAGAVIRRRAEEPHRIELHAPAWTFVIAGPRRREWGFHTERGWVPSTRYDELVPA